MTEAVATTNHTVIRKWAESRDGHPSLAGQGQEKVDRQLTDDTIRFLTEHTDLSPRQAEELVRTHGNDRRKLLKLAVNVKAES